MSRSISRLLTGRARRYLRTSATLLLLSFLALGGYLVVLENQYLKARVDFLDNPNVHFVKITGFSDPTASPYLKFDDVARIDSRITESYPRLRHETSVEYTLGFGVSDTNGDTYFIYGLDGSSAALLGIPALADDTLYSATPPAAEKTTLNVPVVQVETGGMVSSSTVRRTYQLKAGIAATSPLVTLGRPSTNVVYVNVPTFSRIVETAYNIGWNDFRKRYDKDDSFGTYIIRNVWIHVDDLDDVETIGRSINQWGYAATYTLQAFTDVAGSLRSSTIIGLVTVLALVIGCAAYVLLAFNSYLSLSHKDLGILRHFGFSAREAGAVYAHRAATLFATIAVITAGYLAILGAAVVRTDYLKFVGINIGICGALLVCLYASCVFGVIRRHARKDVLTLLKVGKEFE